MRSTRASAAWAAVALSTSLLAVTIVGAHAKPAAESAANRASDAHLASTMVPAKVSNTQDDLNRR